MKAPEHFYLNETRQGVHRMTERSARIFGQRVTLRRMTDAEALEAYLAGSPNFTYRAFEAVRALQITKEGEGSQ